MTSPYLFSLLFPALVVFFFLARAYGKVDNEYLDEWAGAHALALTPVNRPMVRWYLLNARVLRTVGVLGGLFLPGLVASAAGSKQPQFSPFWLFLGYLSGALYAELALTRPAATARAASLVPRHLTDYLPARLVHGQRVIGALGLLAALASAVVPPGIRDVGPSRATAVAVGIGVAIAAMLLERLERWVVGRHQPLVHGDLLAADDAIRSQSVHSLSGSGLALQLALLSVPLTALANSGMKFAVPMFLPILLCQVGAVITCLYYGHRAWRVRRTPAPTPVVT